MVREIDAYDWDGTTVRALLSIKNGYPYFLEVQRADFQPLRDPPPVSAFFLNAEWFAGYERRKRRREMNEPLQVAIIGCGWAGTRHAVAFRANGAAVRWAADTDAARVAGVGAERTTADYRDVLDAADTDAVSICLPHDLHAPVAIAAARAGKHILVEKPLAATLDEADAMIAAADVAGVALMVAENVRYEPVFLKVRALLDAGIIGTPALVQIAREAYLRDSFLRDRPWFLNAKAAAGGIMMSGDVHDFEIMRMLIGEIESVTAHRARQRFTEMEGDDTSVALVRFAGGAVGVLVESFLMKDLTTASGPEVHTLRIDGDLGSLRVLNWGRIEVFSEHPDWRRGDGLTQYTLVVPPGDAFATEIAQFLRTVRTGEESPTSGASQRPPLAVVLAAYRSMETGLPVHIETHD